MYDQLNTRLHRIFLPYILDKRMAAGASGQRFVHYTSADAATKMIKNSEVWLRKSSVMNDFSEIEFGISCLTSAWASPAGTTLKDLLNRMFAGSARRIEEMFTQQLPAIRFDTYLTCISEHDADEDQFGRLSMWRAYGNVAIVVNPAVFMRPQVEAMATYSNPVEYHTNATFQTSFEQMVARIGYEFDFLKAQGETTIWTWMLFAMRQIVLCTKHAGFKEEREWRVIHDPAGSQSPLVRKEVEVLKNVAQPVVKLKLENRPELGVTDLDVPSFVQRIIIGPTQYPGVQREAFGSLLQAHGVDNPYDRIAVSDIPLRN